MNCMIDGEYHDEVLLSINSPLTHTTMHPDIIPGRLGTRQINCIPLLLKYVSRAPAQGQSGNVHVLADRRELVRRSLGAPNGSAPCSWQCRSSCGSAPRECCQQGVAGPLCVRPRLSPQTQGTPTPLQAGREVSDRI